MEKLSLKQRTSLHPSISIPLLPRTYKSWKPQSTKQIKTWRWPFLGGKISLPLRIGRCACFVLLSPPFETISTLLTPNKTLTAQQKHRLRTCNTSTIYYNRYTTPLIVTTTNMISTRSTRKEKARQTPSTKSLAYLTLPYLTLPRSTLPPSTSPYRPSTYLQHHYHQHTQPPPIVSTGSTTIRSRSYTIIRIHALSSVTK